jgi:hypothetical protein
MIGSKAREQQMRMQVQYLGFRITDAGREYTLRASSKASRLFVMVIAHRYFASGQARYQDGPDLCCTKLSRMLADDAATGGDEQDVAVELTVKELLDYRTGRTAATSTRKRARRGGGPGTDGGS